MVEYDIKLGIKSTKHGTGSKDSKSKTIQLRPNDYIRKIDGRTCNFYGQIMLTSIYVSTEQGMRFGPFGEFEDPDREFEVKVKKFSEKNDFQLLTKLSPLQSVGSIVVWSICQASASGMSEKSGSRN